MSPENWPVVWSTTGKMVGSLDALILSDQLMFANICVREAYIN